MHPFKCQTENGKNAANRNKIAETIFSLYFVRINLCICSAGDLIQELGIIFRALHDGKAIGVSASFASCQNAKAEYYDFIESARTVEYVAATT